MDSYKTDPFCLASPLGIITLRFIHIVARINSLFLFIALFTYYMYIGSFITLPWGWTLFSPVGDHHKYSC